MKNKLRPICLAALLLSFTACNDFLDKEPWKTASKPITQLSQLEALMATFESTFNEYNYTFLATDDYGLTPEIALQRQSNISSDDLNFFTWSDKNEQSSRPLWNGEFAKIFTANLILNNIDNVAGDKEKKADLKAEAYFLRAYSKFQLAVCYCLHYNGRNGDEPGLPLKNTTSFEESVARATLKETFASISNDLDEALKLQKRLVQNGVARNWRGSTAGVRALAARFYLYTGDYAKAKQLADEVLAEYSVMKDFNDPNEMYYYDNDEYYIINAGTEREEKVVVRFPYTKLALGGTNGFTELFGWKELLYARCTAYAAWWYVPSRDLLDTFARDIKDGNPDHDLRYRYFVIEDFGLRFCRRTDAGRIPGYCQFYYDTLISGPTVAEMLLIRAEYMARNGNAAEAMTELNRLRRARIVPEAYEPLTASSQADALKKVLDERRREMPLHMRWYDLKRYNGNDDPSDDVTVTHRFFPYTLSSILFNDPIVTHVLKPDSRKYALPLPQADIERSDHVLIQNQY